MFYKVVKDNKVIDVLDRLVYLKYQSKHKRMILCTEEDAQAILSSNGKHIWHEETLYKIPVDDYDTVRVEPIDQYEYEERQRFNMMTADELIDEYTLMLLERQVF